MPTFVWEGKDNKGKKVTGELEAKNIQAVFNHLKGRRITPNAKKIREKGKGLEMEITIPGIGPNPTNPCIIEMSESMAQTASRG